MGGDELESKVLARVFGWREKVELRDQSFWVLGSVRSVAVGGTSAGQAFGEREGQEWKTAGRTGQRVGTLAQPEWVKNRKRAQPCRTGKAFARAGGRHPDTLED